MIDITNRVLMRQSGSGQALVIVLRSGTSMANTASQGLEKIQIRRWSRYQMDARCRLGLSPTQVAVTLNRSLHTLRMESLSKRKGLRAVQPRRAVPPGSGISLCLRAVTAICRLGSTFLSIQLRQSPMVFHLQVNCTRLSTPGKMDEVSTIDHLGFPDMDPHTCRHCQWPSPVG